MNVEDMVLVSIDDHVIEPPGMFDQHVPAAWRDRAPQLITDEVGIQRWHFDDSIAGSMGLNAVVGWPKDEWGMDPTTFAEMRPGAYDIHERVRDMNRNGILGSMCFPSFVGFAGNFFLQAKDKEASLVMTRAYNDWHIDEWVGTYPDRFIPLAVPPIWDAQLVADEMRRVAAKGCQAMTMPELPHVFGLPSYHNMEYWGPVFQAACDAQVVLCMHIGGGFQALKTAPDGPIDNLIVLATQVSALAAQDLLWGPAFRSYPDLKVAWSEGGIGWIPFYLDRCDRHFENQKWLHHDFGGKLPSEVFREHSLACFVSDPTSLKLRHDIGIEIIAWECDYPHSDSVFPNAAEFVHNEMALAGCSDSDIEKISWENSCRFFDWDPFRNRTRAEATVGHLRSLATDVDVTIRSRHEWRELYNAVR
ncbi:MAG TPA: amidohydrolase family protein [Ilumatobacteraceae bacterium]|nr:amidohydrolase family protein [Ilumatobacteraceae bacterium]